MKNPKLVTVGEVITVFGVEGWIKMTPTGENIENFALFHRLYLAKAGDEPRPFELADFREHSGNVVLKLVGVDTRQQGEALRGMLVKVEEESLPRLPPDEFYSYQLVGLEAFTEEGKSLGRVEEIISALGSDVLVVKGEEETLIPFSREFIKRIDEGKITVRLLPEWKK
jgi:16S rRNA processing protein RimM